MALLDVSDIVLDPDFMDSGLIRHRASETVGINGRASEIEADQAFAAVVTSDSGEMLARMPDGSRVSGAIMVHTTLDLTPGKGDAPADEITWQGRRYTVERLADYSHFGTGFNAAICALKSLRG